MRILKLAGADINAYRDESRDNAFLAARYHAIPWHLSVKLRYLLYLGADVNSLDGAGNNQLTNLILINRGSSEKIFSYLPSCSLSMGLILDISNFRGSLHFIMRKDLDLIEL